jgi:hypothetical protein
MDFLSMVLATMLSGKPVPKTFEAPPTDFAAQPNLMANGLSPNELMGSAPPIVLWNLPTPYGVLPCLQRAKQAFYSLNATQIQDNGKSVRATYGATGAVVWCRGDSATLATAGPQADVLAESIRANF